MENRFGFKDVLLCGLTLLAITVAVLALVQIQRQGEVITEVRARLEKQDALLIRLEERAKAAKIAPAAPAASPLPATR